MTTKKYIPVLLVAFALISACADQVNDPAAPVGVRQFTFEATTSLGPVTPVTLTEPAIESFTYGLADGSGGRLQDHVSGHEIKIMPRTVNEPTWFVMKTLPGDNVIVDLTAWRRIDGVWTQITTFNNEGIKLRLSYAKTGVKQPNRLRVAYLPNDSITGPLEPMITQIDKTNKQAQAKLSHFSRYTMAMD